MRHYEIVFLVHPNQSTQVPEMIKQYKSIIESSNGKVHRLEDWGLRQLAYPIKKSNEAYYVLMNIECTQKARKEITESFHFSDAILRNLILGKEKPIIENSPIMRAIEETEKSKRKKENAAPDGDKIEKTPSSKPDDEHIGRSDEKTIAKEDTVKATENKIKPDQVNNDEVDNKETDGDTTSVSNDSQDTLTENEHVDSTKK